MPRSNRRDVDAEDNARLGEGCLGEALLLPQLLDPLPRLGEVEETGVLRQRPIMARRRESFGLHAAETIRSEPEAGRRVLQTLIEGRLTFTPGKDGEGEFYAISGLASVPELIGEKTLVNVASPTGLQRAWKDVQDYVKAA